MGELWRSFPGSSGPKVSESLWTGGPPSPTRVHFNEEDLARVRFSPGPAPLVEAVMGFAELRYQIRCWNRGGWASWASRAFPAKARPLLDLIPSVGPWPAF